MKFLNKIGSKILMLVIVPTVVSTAVAIYISSVNIKKDGMDGLESKSVAILHRMEHVRNYFATQGSMERNIQQVVEDHPDGNLPSEIKEQIKNQVPIFASWNIGREGADIDNYEFRVSSLHPRNLEHQATEQEAKFIEEFQTTGKERIVWRDKANDKLLVMSPVYLSEKQGCLTCHGKPETSPFNNSKDILGIPMENMKDGDMKGMFTIVSDLKPLNKTVNKAILNITVWGVVIALIGIFVSLIIAGRIITNIKKIKTASIKIKEGNYDTVIKIGRNDEIGELAKDLQSMVLSFKKGVDYARKISKGDLRSNPNEQHGELSPLEAELMAMESKLVEVITEIGHVSEKISYESGILTNTTQEISSGANTQAGAAEEVASSMEEMAAIISQTADNARQADKIASEAQIGIGESNQSFKITMDALNQIANQISVIGKIAEKTDVLAINAAIEAARAGEQGKGFAVVAGEIRKLAENSQKAAREINEVVSKSLVIAQRSESLLTDIVPEIEKTARLVNDISIASEEQNSGANQINSAIQELSKVVQQNTSSAYVIAQGAKSMESQADVLEETISFFKTDNHTESKKISQAEQQEIDVKKQKQVKSEMKRDKDGFDINFSENTGHDDDFETY